MQFSLGWKKNDETMFLALVHVFTLTLSKLFSHFLEQILKLQLVQRALSWDGQSSMSLPLFSWVFKHCEYLYNHVIQRSLNPLLFYSYNLPTYQLIS